MAQGDRLVAAERRGRQLLGRYDVPQGDGYVQLDNNGAIRHDSFDAVGTDGGAIGSPTTEGRENAGYGGLFWRGPAAFAGGRVQTPQGASGDELMGWRAPWLAFATPAATKIFRDSPANPGHLADGVLRRIARPAGPRGYGMCGLLTRYDLGTAG